MNDVRPVAGLSLLCVPQPPRKQNFQDDDVAVRPSMQGQPEPFNGGGVFAQCSGLCASALKNCSAWPGGYPQYPHAEDDAYRDRI